MFHERLAPETRRGMRLATDDRHQQLAVFHAARCRVAVERSREAREQTFEQPEKTTSAAAAAVRLLAPMTRTVHHGRRRVTDQLLGRPARRRSVRPGGFLTRRPGRVSRRPVRH